MNELILRAKSGDENALNELVESNIGLVWSVVKRFLNRGYEKEDLFQIGCIGLIKAIKRFDLSLNVKLSTYAIPMIIGEIKRFLRDDGLIKVSRNLKEIALKVKLLKEENEDKDFSIDEIACILNIDKCDIILALEATEFAESLDKKVGNDENGKTLGECIANDEDEYECILNKVTLNDLLKYLDKKEKEVIVLRYFKELTQSKVADILETSQVQISRIEKRAIEKMMQGCP